MRKIDPSLLTLRFHSWAMSQPSAVQVSYLQDVACVNAYLYGDSCNTATAYDSTQRLSTLAQQAALPDVASMFFDLLIDLNQEQEAECF